LKGKKYIVIGALALLLLLSKRVKAETIIKEFEGEYLDAYLDPVGIPTIGYGTTRNPDTGRKIKLGDKIDKATALRWLRLDTEKVRESVKKMVKVPINARQLDALTSFVYNVGPTAFADSTMLKLLNNKTDKRIVANQFDRWVYAKRVKLPGLVRRRKLEKELFLS
jgi:lysozyme